jgi:predicted RND superfamily exporter protein
MTDLGDRIAQGWGRTCMRYRKTVLLALAAFTALTAGVLPGVHFNNALSTWFVDDDPALVEHRHFRETFGSDEVVVVGIEAPDVFAPDVVEQIGRITRAIERAPHVEKVFSLTSVESITGRGDEVEVGDLVPFPLDPGALPEIRRRALASQLYVDNVVSRDGRFAAIIARLPHDPAGFKYKVEAVGAIRHILRAERGDAFHLAGGPVFDEQFFRQSEIDTIKALVLMSIVLVAILAALTRTVAGVLLPLVTVGTATVWTVGSMVLLGVEVNIITTILPPLLLAVGVADAMHFLVDYQNRCRAGDDRMTAIHEVYRELFAPLFVAGLTTAVGMGSLSVSRIQAIRDFGLFAAYGVAAEFLLTVTFVPIALSYLPAPGVNPERRRKPYLSTRALGALHRFTVGHGFAIVAAWTLTVVASLVLSSRIHVESSFIRIFKESSRIRQDIDLIQRRLAGSGTVEIELDTGVADGVKDPRILRIFDDLESFLLSQPSVSSVQSINAYYKDLRRAFYGNDQREYRLPQTREEAAQYLLLYEMDAPEGDIREYTTFDYRKARISARVDLTTSNEAVALSQALETYMAERLPPDVHGRVTGLMVIYARLDEYIRDSMLQGFAGALIAIFLVFCVQMRSVLLGGLVMISNTMPIMIMLGVMGLTGIRLDSMTAMVASIAIGLADDDSIHFVSRVRLRMREGHDVVRALHDSLVEVGRALVYSCLALCSGFAVMLTAGFVGAIYFGLLTMLTILIALLADLLLLPVLLRWYDSGLRPRLDLVEASPSPSVAAEP